VTVGRERLLWLVLASCCAVSAAGCSSAPAANDAAPAPAATPFVRDAYHAVVLTSGQVYYAKIAGEQDGFLTLTDIFYIVGQPAPPGQPIDPNKGSLIRRGRELHGPERMLVNRAHVLFVEPVSPTSRVGLLIKEANERNQ
jgi:hypothetical protein